jgi:hypothetical protein
MSGNRHLGFESRSLRLERAEARKLHATCELRLLSIYVLGLATIRFPNGEAAAIAKMVFAGTIIKKRTLFGTESWAAANASCSAFASFVRPVAANATPRPKCHNIRTVKKCGAGR